LECADWTRHAADYFGEMMELTLSKIKKNDDLVLASIQEIIRMLEGACSKERW